MKPTLNQLKIFRVVAELNSYTRAASQLQMSQPAVSMQIRQLEETVGLPLIEQLGKKIYLTEAGEIISQCAEEISRQLNEAEEKVHQLQGIRRGKLKISVATTASYFVIRMLARFSDLYPGIRISLDVTNRHTLLQQLSNHERDLVIMGEPPENMNLAARPFMDNPLIMVAAGDHPLKNSGELELADLERETFVIREKESGTRAAIERFFAAAGCEIHSTMEMSSNEAIKQAVQAGLGLGIVSSHTVQLELETRCLSEIPVQGFPIMRTWYLVQNAKRQLSPVASLFETFVLENRHTNFPEKTGGE